jgi:chemotaxis signal transduction protein
MINANTETTVNSICSNLDLQSCEKYCVFQRRNSTFGLLASVVQEVALRPQIAVVPDADPLLAGICHLRNEFLPVLRLSEFSLEQGPQSSGQQIVVISAANGPWALLVDRVIGLVPLEVSLCSDVGATHGWSAAVMGSATHESQIVQVLDTNALLRFAEQILNRYWRGEMKV